MPRFGYLWTMPKTRCLGNTFIIGNTRESKLSFTHITDISTARTYLSLTNQSGLTRVFRPYIVLWGFDQFSRSYATSTFYSALCVFVRVVRTTFTKTLEESKSTTINNSVEVWSPITAPNEEIRGHHCVDRCIIM